MLNFPDSPTLNQQFTSGGNTWVWDGTKWISSNIFASQGGYLPLTGGTLTGTLVGTTVSLGTGTYQGGTFVANGLALPTLQLDKTATAGSTSRIIGSRANNFRWELYLGNTTSEGTNSVGSDFQIDAYDDTGALLSTPLLITRASGNATFSGSITGKSLTLTGSPIMVGGGVANASLVLWSGLAPWSNNINAFKGAAQNLRWALILGDSTTEGGSNAGSNFAINNYADNGTALTTPLLIARATGQATFSSPAIFPSNAVNTTTNPNGLDGVTIDGAAGSGVAVCGARAGSIRWRMVLGNNATESGNNVGSDFSLNCYSDTSGFIGAPIRIQRNSGWVEINGFGAVATGGPGTLPYIASHAVIRLNHGSTSALSANYLQGFNNGSIRWSMMIGDNTSETGGNIGSDFSLSASDDTGAGLGIPFLIRRWTGAINFNGYGAAPWNVNLVPSSMAVALSKAPGSFSNSVVGAMNGSSRWGIVLGNTAGETGGNVGSDFQIQNYNDSGIPLGTAIFISRINGYVYFNAPGATLPPLGASAGHALIAFNKNFGGGAAAGNYINCYSNGSIRWQMVLGNGTTESSTATGSDFAFSNYNNAGTLMGTPFSINRANSQATFSVAIVNGPSDRRLKEHIEPIEDALDKIMKLQGVSFNRIGDESKKREIGLIAQDVESIIPEVIQTYQTISAENSGAETPMFAIDYPKLTAVLIEALKILTLRIEALEMQ